MISSDKLPSLATLEEAKELDLMLFDRYDTNRSGFLESNEIELMLKDVPRIINSETNYPG